MQVLKRVLVLVGLFLFFSCGHQQKGANGQAKELVWEDFLGMFHPLKLPASFADSSLARKPTDSLLTWAAFSQFAPDSLLQKYFGKTARPRLFAFGKQVVKNAETYLFIKVLGTTKKAIYILCFDKQGTFTTGMPIVFRDPDSDIRYASAMDAKYTLSVSRQHKDGLGRLFYKRAVYVYSNEGVFTLIMNESNEGKPKVAQIYNPIDTLSHKHKFSGDYLQDKRNFISFRDGKNNSVVRFFVHFEKDNDSCKGELRGDARFVSSNVARYIANGDPCSLEFNFTDKTVRMKELEGCGNHRDIKCYFDGVYEKHKEPKATGIKPKRR